MTTAMIVDDEPIIRKGILTSIDWDKTGIYWVDEAGNGKDALSKALIHKPDIVVTDIKMPIMDGIEFSKELRSQLPKTKIVFLTGYNDFDYLRHALKVGAMDYLLKPVNVLELVNLMKKLKQEVEEESKFMIDKMQESQLMDENLLWMRFKIINQFIKSEIPVAEFIQRSKTIGVDLAGPGYQIVRISINNYHQIIENGEKEIYLLKYAIINFAEEILARNMKVSICDVSQDTIIALLSHNTTSKVIIENCKEIQYYIKKYFKFSITIGIGQRVETLQELKHSFYQAEEAIENRNIKEKDQIIMYDNDKFSTIMKVKLFLDEQEEKYLKEQLSLLNNKEVYAILDGLFVKYFYNQEIKRKTLEQLCMNLISIAVKELEQYHISPILVLDRDYYFYNEIYKYETLEDVELWITSIFNKTLASIEEHKNNKYKNVVVKALKYAKEHYNENLRISDIANEVFVTPNYFSKIFKEETGENFTEWLNKYRVEQAKKLMVIQPESKIYDIAEATGFHDYKYFTFIFKKYTGHTPYSYKEIFGK